MVKILLLQQLYNLSDEQLEYQLLDRLSFQRFAGLRLDMPGTLNQSEGQRDYFCGS
ncbi:MAG: transposase [Methylococcales bacterium]|nr:transposase [Methylococcales bacterium]